MNQHFLQSTAWQTFQEALGRPTFRQSGTGWEFLAVLEAGVGNKRLYCPYGPSAVNVQAFGEALQALTTLAKQQKAAFIRVEPTNSEFAEYLRKNHWQKASYIHLNPEHTSVLDLSLDEAALLTAMAQPVRSRWRNHQKKGMQIHRSTNPQDISIFLQFIHEVAERTGMRPHSDAYFQKQASTLFPIGAASLWYVTFENKPIAAAIFYDSDTTRYYAHAAASSNPEYRKLNANTPLVAEALLDAKKQSLAYFDLYGIAPEGAPASHPWAGFTKFKQSFGGHTQSFAGVWELPLNKPLYLLYRAYQTLRRR